MKLDVDLVHGELPRGILDGNQAGRGGVDAPGNAHERDRLSIINRSNLLKNHKLIGVFIKIKMQPEFVIRDLNV